MPNTARHRRPLPAHGLRGGAGRIVRAAGRRRVHSGHEDHGVPSEVVQQRLQFTGRFTNPRPDEALFACASGLWGDVAIL